MRIENGRIFFNEKMSQIITALIMTGVLVGMILFISINHQPTLYEQILFYSRIQSAIKQDEFTKLIEVQELVNSGVPISSIYAHIFNKPKLFDGEKYLITSGEKLTIYLDDLKARTWSVEQVSFSNFIGGSQGVTIDSIAATTITDNGTDYPAATIQFNNFILNQDLVHKTMETRISISGSYTYSVIGVNTYAESSFDRNKIISFFIITIKEKELLNAIIKLCNERYCYISESLNNLTQ